MPKATMTGTDEEGFVDDSAPVDPMILAQLTGGTTMAPMRTAVGSRLEVLLELAGIKTAIRLWHTKQPDQVLYEASAYSARLTEMWTELRLIESHDRTYTQLRTMQVQPVLDEIDRQHRFTTSRIAIARQDIDLSR